MSTFKFKPWAVQYHPYYSPLTDKSWFRVWNHPLNPLGNWLEPLPFPEKRRLEAEASWLNNWVWWSLRNPAHNFFTFWVGIVPVGQRYEWIKPEERGWSRSTTSNLQGTETISWWIKPYRLSLPYLTREVRVMGSVFDFAIGWTSDGRLAFRFRKGG